MMICPILLLLLLTCSITVVHSHGFLSTPRSRNYVAYADRVYYPLTSSNPLPEDCPSCLNRGGTLARCGVLNPGGGETERNYDLPLNALGSPMHANPQQTYYRGQIIDVEVVLTAHHKGHFVFKACPISSTTESPTQDCFDAHPLKFVSDELYGANVDGAHPERVYVAPETVAQKVTSSNGGEGGSNSNGELQKDFPNALLFKYKLQLPPNLIGELVLIQWYYVATNSGCVHQGYDNYDWPNDWIGGEKSYWDEKGSVGKGLKSCEEVLPEDGNGIPEQFWNCAEVTITEAPQPKQQQASLMTSNINGRQHTKTIIGYYASWQWYDRQKLAEPSNMDFTKVTRVNFAFFQTDKNGNLWGTDSWADPNLLFGPYNWNPSENDIEYCSWDTPSTKTCKAHHFEEGLIHQVHAAGAEIYPSLGGWSLSDPFPEMAANAKARMNFVEKCIELIEDYDFDGLDIDWEYPGYEDHSGTPADTENYNLLLRELRWKLDELGQRTGRFYGLTAALPCGTKNIANIDIQTVAQYLTEFNLMTYDFFGAWSPTSGTNAPLYDQDWGDDDVKDFSVDGCVRNWVKGGASPSAINLGLPFYGRSFLKAKGLNEQHEGNDKNTWFWDDGSPQYFNIVEKLPELVSVRHELTKTQYAYKDTTAGGLVSYDDEQAICDKTEYCLDHDLNGFIIWELSGDLMPDLSTPLLDAVNSKLTDPTLDCKTLAYDPNKLSEDTPVSSQQVSITNVETKPPTRAPSTPAPTVPLFCPEGATGPRQYEGCTGYYYCVYGIPSYPAIPCPEGTLFDENTMLCLHSETVTSCSGSRSPTSSPSKMPTKELTEQPTQSRTIPSTDPPVFTFMLLGGKNQSKPSPAIPSSNVPVAGIPSPYDSISNIQVAPADSVESTDITTPAMSFEEQTTPMSKPTSSPSKQPNLSSSHANVVSTATEDAINTPPVSCPDGYTGVMPWNDCTEYVYCIYAVPHLPTIHCQDGKLFDARLQTCMDASQVVSCSPNTVEAAMKPPSKRPSNTPTKMPSYTPTKRPSYTPTKPPLTQQSPGSIQTTASSAQSFVGGIIPSDPSPSSTALAESFFDNGDSSSSYQAAPLDSKPEPESPLFLTEIHHNNIISYQWSSASYSESSSTRDSSLPQGLVLASPYITVEILLSDSPGDIGWQLVSLDGLVNVGKPTGAYSFMKPKTVVYEGISLQTDLVLSASFSELRWTILNVKGHGANWKLYAGPPTADNLLAMGDKFEYMETVSISVAENGEVSLIDGSTTEQVEPFSTPMSSPLNQEPGSDNQGNGTNGTYTEEMGLSALEAHSNLQSNDQKEKPSMVLAIILLVAIVFVAGLCCIGLAYRRKPSSSSRVLHTLDQEKNFDEWDLGCGPSGVATWDADYYSESHYGQNVIPMEEYYEEEHYEMEMKPGDYNFERNSSFSSDDRRHRVESSPEGMVYEDPNNWRAYIDDDTVFSEYSSVSSGSRRRHATHHISETFRPARDEVDDHSGLPTVDATYEDDHCERGLTTVEATREVYGHYDNGLPVVDGIYEVDDDFINSLPLAEATPEIDDDNCEDGINNVDDFREALRDELEAAFDADIYAVLSRLDAEAGGGDYTGTNDE